MRQDSVERRIKTIGKWGFAPDTVHLVTVEHAYANREYVVAVCGRKGRGIPGNASCRRCHRCFAAEAPS